MSKKNSPRHIAVIMDGNGRWAQGRGLPRVAGHHAGVENVREIVRASVDFNVPILTLYAFSQENWKRPKEEVGVLMKLLDSYLDREVAELHREGVQIRFLGRIEMIAESILKKITQAVETTKNNQKLILNIALNYGSRQEILDAVAEAFSEASRHPEDKNFLKNLTEEKFSKYLYTRDLPDPDLLIRTSGEMRLSNFLLWQLSYTEIYVTKKYWPDFHREDYREAIEDYMSRERRFGDVLA